EQQKAKAEAKVASLKARPSYPDINQLTNLLVTSIKPEFSKLLASHDFASCLPNALKEISSKFTELSREIKELKKHVQDMEIELPVDLKEIPKKLETFTSTIFSLSSQVAEMKNIQWELSAEFQDLPSLRFATMVENASRATTKDVPSAGQATASPTEGEKNTTKDAETNLQNELVDLLGIDVKLKRVVSLLEDLQGRKKIALFQKEQSNLLGTVTSKFSIEVQQNFLKGLTKYRKQACIKW
ncbi:hypothetical protein Tco_0882786, partial [Tanacetum coccineum]